MIIGIKLSKLWPMGRQLKKFNYLQQSTLRNKVLDSKQ